MTLSIVLPNLLTWDGSEPVIGGLERLAWSLIGVARDAGYDVDVHQNGSSDWVRTVGGVVVHGHGLARLSPLAAMESIHHATTRCLYFSLLQTPATYRAPSLVVSHGVWWDSPRSLPKESLIRCQTALREAQEIVAVDYNFLNVMRAVFPSLAHKISVIPNFVDTGQFAPAVEPRAAPPTVLFPRRLDPARGLDLFLASIGPVLDTMEDLAVTLSVDRNNQPLNDRLRRQLEEFPHASRVRVVTTPFDQMPQLYRDAAAVVIPSTHSEGTSLAALEAMASGLAVIATDVGGLTNLIISGFNGLLVPPRPDTLTAAMVQVLKHRDYAAELGRHARQTALAFGRARWEAQWLDALRRVYGPPPGDVAP